MSKIRTRAGAVLAGATLIAGALAPVPATFAAPDTPTHLSPQATGCTQVQVQAQKFTGFPGEYQLAYDGQNIYTTFANGRPPVLTAGIGVYQPGPGAAQNTHTGAAQAFQSTILMPVTDYTPRGSDTVQGKQIMAPYGIASDFAGKLWVTNTLQNSVTVLDISGATPKQVFPKMDGGISINHPREVRLDGKGGHAFISHLGGVTVLNSETFSFMKTFDFTYEGKPDPAMNMFVDSMDSKLYVPLLYSGEVKVIDTKSLEVVQTLKLPKQVEGAQLRPSDVVVDHNTSKIFISAQGEMDRATGVSKGNSGVLVYDLKTMEYQETLGAGPQTLPLALDENGYLLYAGDFSDGTIRVIDTRFNRVVKIVKAGQSGVNDLIYTDRGVFATVRDVTAQNTISYATIDPATGEYLPAATGEPKGENGAQVPFSSGGIVEIHAQATETTGSCEVTELTPTLSNKTQLPQGVKVDTSEALRTPAPTQTPEPSATATPTVTATPTKAADEPKSDKPEANQSPDKAKEDAAKDEAKADAKTEAKDEAKSDTQKDSKTLAKTGANGIVIGLGVAALSLAVGIILVVRRRKL